jgi:hypothetical protein
MVDVKPEIYLGTRPMSSLSDVERIALRAAVRAIVDIMMLQSERNQEPLSN